MFKFSKNILIICTVLFAILSQAGEKMKSGIITEKIEYKEGSSILEGFLVYDSEKVNSKNVKLPAIIIVHDWMGVSDYVKMRAEQVAKLGYVAFVADIYGKGNRPKDAKEAAEIAGKYRSGDRKSLRARGEAAYNEIKKNKFVDPSKITAIGYCFGGSTVLEMARSGLSLNAVISFHGGLATGNLNDAKNIKSKLLILHGAIDPFVSNDEVNVFQKEMNDAKIDYQFISYSGAVHAFTQKLAGNDITKGAAYNEKADERSFLAMKNFLQEVNY